MSQDKFDSPRVRLTRIYTRTGDEGETGLVGGQRVPKDDARIEAYGTVDELNACLGLAARTLADLPEPGDLSPWQRRLRGVQHELFNLGSLLATRAEDLRPGQAVVTPERVRELEAWMDEANEALPPLTSFVLPGGSRLAAELHLCRTVCRRAERRIVTLATNEPVSGEAIRYLNRLSDLFFVLSRLANSALG
jgi:cob(I)alamin adenosyltransferase